MKTRDLLLIVGLSFANLSDGVNNVRCEVVQENLEQKLNGAYQEVVDSYYVPEDDLILILLGDNQKLYVLDRNGSLKKEYEISTAVNGFGNKNGSKKTPEGVHRIAYKYGTDAKYGTIFDAKKRMNGVFKSNSGRALITSRIMTIEGVEPDNQNTYFRSIYIHGTNKENEIGRPASHGCIRMKNRDIIELYDLVKQGTYINIVNTY